jgi:hypothetical protein
MSAYPPPAGIPPQQPYQPPPPRKSWPSRHMLLTAFLCGLGLFVAESQQ